MGAVGCLYTVHHGMRGIRRTPVAPVAPVGPVGGGAIDGNPLDMSSYRKSLGK